MPSFSIGHFGKERLEITVIGPPANAKTEGVDWVRAEVQIDAGAFTGKLEIWICLSDVIRFKNQLEPVHRDLKGVAEFTTIEGQLYIRIELDNLGHVQGSGYIIDDFVSGNKLTFNIDYDQTLLLHSISEIDKLLSDLSAHNSNY